MKNKLLIGSAAALGTLALAAGVFASTGSGNNDSFAWMNKMHQAMQSGDYKTWKETADQNGMGQMIGNVDEKSFSQMQQMHEAMLQENNDKANAIHQHHAGHNAAGGCNMMGL